MKMYGNYCAPVHIHAQTKWVNLWCGCDRNVDLIESLNHKSYHNFYHKSYHNFYHKSYRQRQSHYPSTTKLGAQTNKSRDSARRIPQSDPIFADRRGSWFFECCACQQKLAPIWMLLERNCNFWKQSGKRRSNARTEGVRNAPRKHPKGTHDQTGGTNE